MYKSLLDRPYLEHHGIKGQRWGIRRKSKEGGGSGGGKTEKRSDDYLSAKSLKKKGRNQMSNKELNTYLSRRDLEKRYDAIHPDRRKQVISWLGSTLLKAATTSAKREISNRANAQMNDLVKDIFDAVLSSHS